MTQVQTQITVDVTFSWWLKPALYALLPASLLIGQKRAVAIADKLIGRAVCTKVVA